MKIDGKEASATEFEAAQVAKFEQNKAQQSTGLPVSMARVINQCGGEGWQLYHGDSCEVTKGIPDNSIDFMVKSPPFKDLFVYSDSPRDLGNCATAGEFSAQFQYLVREEFRILRPGRLNAVHCMDLPKTITRDGIIGLSDFPGELVRIYESAGFVFHSRIIIWKDPVVAMQRTHARGLLHKELCRDSSVSRMGICDQVLVFGKPGKNETPIPHKSDSLGTKTNGKPLEWQRYASPVWAMPVTIDDFVTTIIVEAMSGRHVEILKPIFWNRYAAPVWASASGIGDDGFVTYCNPTTDNKDGRGIDQGDTLQRQRAEGDERHVCPLQRGVIRRCLELWSLPGETVFTPFAGIGSEMVCALEADRRAVGIELKKEYYEQARAHIETVIARRAQLSHPALT